MQQNFKNSFITVTRLTMTVKRTILLMFHFIGFWFHVGFFYSLRRLPFLKSDELYILLGLNIKCACSLHLSPVVIVKEYRRDLLATQYRTKRI